MWRLVLYWYSNRLTLFVHCTDKRTLFKYEICQKTVGNYVYTEYNRNIFLQRCPSGMFGRIRLATWKKKQKNPTTGNMFWRLSRVFSDLAKADENWARLSTNCVEWVHLTGAEIKPGALFMAHECSYCVMFAATRSGYWLLWKGEPKLLFFFLKYFIYLFMYLCIHVCMFVF